MLPRENERAIAPPQKVRLAIGSSVWNPKAGRMIPQKDDHFTVRRLSKQEKGATYIVDQELQAAMCEAAGVTEKPTAIPVTVIGNASMGLDGKTPTLPESILFSEMARYSGSRRECVCRQFGADGKGLAHRRYYETKQKKSGTGTYKLLAREEDIACDPDTCPFATGVQNEGVPTCKPHVIANVLLPWAASVGTAAKFKTTGWTNYYGMRDSLFVIAMQTNGWLHDIPLMFVFDWARNTDGQLIPAVRFEFRGDVEELRAKAIPRLKEWQQSEGQLKALQAGIIESTLEIIEDPDEQEATQAEFYPEAAAPQKHGTASRIVVPEVAREAPEGVVEGQWEPTPAPDEPTKPEPPTGQDGPPPEETPPSGMFPVAPRAPLDIVNRFKDLGEVEAGRAILETARGHVGKGAPQDALFREYLRLAESWWEREGAMAHGGGEPDGVE